jgi:hypothetical protein
MWGGCISPIHIKLVLARSLNRLSRRRTRRTAGGLSAREAVAGSDSRAAGGVCRPLLVWVEACTVRP